MTMDDIQPLLFWLLAGLTGLSAIATVVTHNIVRAATWLLFTLAGVTGVFFLLGADLVGATQLLVYVGGTLVLVVFGVMLTAQGPFISIKTSSPEWGISAVAGLLLFGVLSVAIMKVGKPAPPAGSVTAQYAPEKRQIEEARAARKDPKTPIDEAKEAKYTSAIGQGLLGVGVGPAHIERPPDLKLPRPVRTHYLLPFEIVSVHLLVVLIGAAYLARAKRRQGADA